VSSLTEPVSTYRHQLRKAKRLGVPTVGRAALLKDFVPWLRSRGHSTLTDERPWVTFEAARLMETMLPPLATALEFGSGGSTLFLGPRVQGLTSVEHDPAWYEAVRPAVEELSAVQLLLREPRPATNPEESAIASTNDAYAGQTFADYVAVADQFEDGQLDLLIVDGRARVATFFRSAPKVRTGGLIVLDDSERAEYRPVVDAARAAGWLERGSYGPKPFTPWFARTTLWTKSGELPAAAG